jgi:hypothetical protein
MYSGSSPNNRAAPCQRFLPFLACRWPLRKYDGQAGSHRFVRRITTEKRASVERTDQLPDGQLGSSPETVFEEMTVRAPFANSTPQNKVVSRHSGIRVYCAAPPEGGPHDR